MHKTLFAGTVLYCAAALATDYYVDAENGDDGYTGTAPIEDLSGTTGPKKSLKGAMEISGLKSGDVVWAAAGVYSNEVMTTTETIGSASVTVKNRVVVPASVTLKAIRRLRVKSCTNSQWTLWGLPSTILKSIWVPMATENVAEMLIFR